MAPPLTPGSSLDGQRRGAAVWLTGLPAAGKSSIALAMQDLLHARRIEACVLDGDLLRRGLCSDLGFSRADRSENVRRVAEVARLMVDARLIVLVALISPFEEDRATARHTIGSDRFVEVHVDTPLAVAEARDPKGLYARARHGAARDVTGIDSPYEPPKAPDIRIDTTRTSIDDAARLIAQHLQQMRLLSP